MWDYLSGASQDKRATKAILQLCVRTKDTDAGEGLRVNDDDR